MFYAPECTGKSSLSTVCDTQLQVAADERQQALLTETTSETMSSALMIDAGVQSDHAVDLLSAAAQRSTESRHDKTRPGNHWKSSFL